MAPDLTTALLTMTLTGIAAPAHREEHRQANWLRDVILGGQDGLVNILGIILGVIAGGGAQAVLLAAGFAAAITESISMGAVGWTSALAERDYYQAVRGTATPPRTPSGRRSVTPTPPRASPGTCRNRWSTPSPPTATRGRPR
jgi:VIT family